MTTLERINHVRFLQLCGTKAPTSVEVHGILSAKHWSDSVSLHCVTSSLPSMPAPFVSSVITELVCPLEAASISIVCSSTCHHFTIAHKPKGHMAIHIYVHIYALGIARCRRRSCATECSTSRHQNFQCSLQVQRITTPGNENTKRNILSP